jgi:hypothetical protein
MLKSELNARNKITATGALVVPGLRYSFGIINWRLEEIKQIDSKTRKMLMYKMHHPKADTDRLYVKIKKGRERQLRTERGVGGSNQPPTPKFRSFGKAEPNSQFRGIYIRNNLIRIRVSLICKLSETPD